MRSFRSLAHAAVGAKPHLPLVYRAEKWYLDEHAVSPVIGTILVLAISIVGTAAVLYWGLPAIDEMKANVEQRTIENQFRELDSDIKELVAGTAGKTAKRWEPTIDRGDFVMEQSAQRWLLAIDKQKTAGRYNFTWGGFSTTTASTASPTAITIGNIGDTIGTGASNHTIVKAYSIAGALFTQLNVSLTGQSSPAPAPAQMDSTSFTSSWKGAGVSGATQSFTITNRNTSVANSPFPLKNVAMKMEIWDGPTLAAEAWLFDLGQAHWIFKGSQTSRDTFEMMGAVITGGNGAFAVTNSPTLPAPKITGGVYRFFGREVQMNGSASFGGSNRFDILVNLYDTSPLEDLSCLSTDKTTCAKDVKLYLEGSLATTWANYFRGASNGYSFSYPPNPLYSTFPADPQNYLMDWKSTGMAFSLLHSVVTLTG